MPEVFFLASSSNGINTDEQWRCTNVFDDGWFLPNYTDSSWPKALVVGSNTLAYYIAQGVRWIKYKASRALSTSNKIFYRRNLTTGKD